MESHDRRPGFNDIIRAIPASTPFIAPESLARQSGRPFRARLGANESPFGPGPRAVEAMRSALEQVGLYGDPENYDLRTAVAERECVSPERIVVGAGIDDLLGLLVRVLMNPGDVAVASLGAYPTVGFHLAGYGARVESVPYREYRNDLDGLVSAALRSGARVVYLSNPDNPTSSWFPGAVVAELLAQVPRDCMFLLDEAYIELAPDAAHSDLPVDDPRLIRLRTFSKAYGMAGARIGYAITPPAVATMANKVRLHFGVNRIAQAGALAALQDSAHLEWVLCEVRNGREEYTKLAGELGLSALPSATNFVALDVGSAARSQLVVRELAERGVFIRAPTAEGLNHLVRISVGDAAQRAIFAEALRDIYASMP